MDAKTVRIQLLFDLFLRVHAEVTLHEVLLTAKHRERHEQLTKRGGYGRHSNSGIHVEAITSCKVTEKMILLLLLFLYKIGFDFGAFYVLHELEKVQPVPFLGHVEHVQRTLGYEEPVHNDHYAAADHH